ncbi:MAG: hypothetical protein OQL28_04320 [Sedimenticola sp.]|nr:hypothetical protein [Sedimenticola sp.]
MRRQQINLYQPVFRRQAVTFSLNVVLGLSLLSLLLMGALYGFAQWQSGNLQQQRAELEARHQELEQRVAEMAQKLPKPTVNKLLERELQQLVDRRRAGADLLNMLQTRIESNPEGFSGYVEGLARQSGPEVWLTRIQVADAGATLLLAGKTLQPEAVPRLLQQLQSEAAFAGKSFQVMELVRLDEFDPALEFKLQTMAVEEQE